MEQTEQELIVIKAGTNVLVNHQGINQQQLDHYAELWSPYTDRYQMIIVSSGAVALGKSIWTHAYPGDKTETDQPFAMLGSAGVVEAWAQAFKPHNKLVSQVLVTHRDVADMDRHNTFERALRENLKHEIIPVVNENDALNTEELDEERYGAGNDGLAAEIAIRLGARALFLMTDQRGVLQIKSHHVIHEIETDRDRENALEHANLFEPSGRGGMHAKLYAGFQAADAGVEVYIANPNTSLQKITAGKAGTHIFARNQAA